MDDCSNKDWESGGCTFNKYAKMPQSKTIFWLLALTHFESQCEHKVAYDT